MTLEEAKKVAAIVSTADGGCGHCANRLRELLVGDFPEFSWTMEYNEVVVAMVMEGQNG